LLAAVSGLRPAFQADRAIHAFPERLRSEVVFVNLCIQRDAEGLTLLHPALVSTSASQLFCFALLADRL
jgi:hypothetical protein